MESWKTKAKLPKPQFAPKVAEPAYRRQALRLGGFASIFLFLEIRVLFFLAKTYPPRRTGAKTQRERITLGQFDKSGESSIVMPVTVTGVTITMK
jgi:hypothetical protein